MPRRTWSLLLAGLALAATACASQADAPTLVGGADAPATADTSAPTSVDPTSTLPTGAATSSDEITRCPSFDEECVPNLPANTVELRGIMFNPAELTVAAGTTITFTNLDPVAHTATAGTREAPTPELFDIAFSGEGDSGTTAISEPGTYPYFCKIHPGMDGKLVIE